MLVVNKCSDLCESFEQMSSDRLKEMLVEKFEATIERIVEIASIVRVLENRGEDLDELKIGMIDWFRRVAYGQVLPEVLINYGDNQKLLKKISNLPIPDQKRISSGESVEVLAYVDGAATERKVSPYDMTNKEINQVFCNGKIRSLSEQRGYLEEKKPRFHSTESATPEVRIDKRKKQLVITGATKLSRSQLFSYLSQMGD